MILSNSKLLFSVFSVISMELNNVGFKDSYFVVTILFISIAIKAQVHYISHDIFSLSRSAPGPALLLNFLCGLRVKTLTIN